MVWPELVPTAITKAGAEAYTLHNPPLGWWMCTDLPDKALVLRSTTKGQHGTYEWVVLKPVARRRGEVKRWEGRHTLLEMRHFSELKAMSDAKLEHREILEDFPVGRVVDLPSVVLVQKPLPEVALKPSDLILMLPDARRGITVPLPNVVGRSWPLARAAHSPLRDALVSDEASLLDLTPWSARRSSGGVLDRLRNAVRWGKAGPNWQPRFQVWRTIPYVVSEPIQASGDEAAIFELLCSVGCRMPTQDRARCPRLEVPRG